MCANSKSALELCLIVAPKHEVAVSFAHRTAHQRVITVNGIGELSISVTGASTAFKQARMEDACPKIDIAAYK